WSLQSGSGSFPNAIGDVAQFNAGYGAAQTALVNQPITVGEIDFGSSQNITINASGTNTLTLQASSGPSILDVGQTFGNTGVDIINAPVVVAGATGLTATVSGGTLQLTNTATGALANVIGNTSAFNVNSGGTLRESAVGTGSLVTGNLV